MKNKYTVGEFFALGVFWLFAGASGLSLVWFLTTLFLPADMPGCPPIAWWGLWPAAAWLVFVSLAMSFLALKEHWPEIAAAVLWFLNAALTIGIIIVVIKLLF